MSISGIYILDVRGKVLISRDYRGDVDQSVLEKFSSWLRKKEDTETSPPVLYTNGVTFSFINVNCLYFVTTTKKNANSALVFLILHQIVEIMTQYFNIVAEESIKDNFVIIYELLDEFIDFGYPQLTNSNILKKYVMQEGKKLEISSVLPLTVTNAVSWRQEGLKYKKDEVFLDVVESINMLVNVKGNILKYDVFGVINMRTCLSGMPELRLGLNDKVLYENLGQTIAKTVDLDFIKFHQCVRLSRFENERMIIFVPPDGDFELMSYRLSLEAKPVIWIGANIFKWPHSRIEFIIKALSQFKEGFTAQNVQIFIPVPEDVDSPKLKPTAGYAKYIPESDAVLWNIKSFPGGKEYILTARFSLPSVELDVEGYKRPITVKFEIPHFTTSGIHVRYLKVVESSGYKALPWVRYCTNNGEYEFRVL